MEEPVDGVFQGRPIEGLEVGEKVGLLRGRDREPAGLALLGRLSRPRPRVGPWTTTEGARSSGSTAADEPSGIAPEGSDAIGPATAPSKTGRPSRTLAVPASPVRPARDDAMPTPMPGEATSTAAAPAAATAPAGMAMTLRAFAPLPIEVTWPPCVSPAEAGGRVDAVSAWGERLPGPNAMIAKGATPRAFGSMMRTIATGLPAWKSGGAYALSSGKPGGPKLRRGQASAGVERAEETTPVGVEAERTPGAAARPGIECDERGHDPAARGSPARAKGSRWARPRTGPVAGPRFATVR